MARLRTKREQREYVRPRAKELARSENFIDCYAIEVHLRTEEGCPKAKWILNEPELQEELNSLCQEAQQNTPFR